MSITFTQYLRPDGQPRLTDIERPKEIEEMAEKFILLGGRFTCELLSTGHVALYAESVHNTDEEPAAMELVHNGPDVLTAVDALVTRALSVAEKGWERE